MNARGIFDIFTVENLFRKLEHDCERVAADPADRWAAIDFVLTADSLRNWACEDRAGHEGIGDSVVVQVCRDLANRAKHWRAGQLQVRESKAVGAAFQFDAFGPGFQRGVLIVALEDGGEKQSGAEIGIGDLAVRTVAFWREELGL